MDELIAKLKEEIEQDLWSTLDNTYEEEVRDQDDEEARDKAWPEACRQALQQLLKDFTDVE